MAQEYTEEAHACTANFQQRQDEQHSREDAFSQPDIPPVVVGTSSLGHTTGATNSQTYKMVTVRSQTERSGDLYRGTYIFV